MQNSTTTKAKDTASNKTPEQQKEIQASSDLETNVSGVFKLQALTTVLMLVLVTLGSLWLQADILLNAKSSLLGALLSVIGTWLSARSVRRTRKVKDEELVDGQGHFFMVPVFSGLINKLIIVGGGIAFGLVVLGLEPILLVLSYLAVQITSAFQLLR